MCETFSPAIVSTQVFSLVPNMATLSAPANIPVCLLFSIMSSMVRFSDFLVFFIKVYATKAGTPLVVSSNVSFNKIPLYGFTSIPNTRNRDWVCGKLNKDTLCSDTTGTPIERSVVTAWRTCLFLGNNIAHSFGFVPDSINFLKYKPAPIISSRLYLYSDKFTLSVPVLLLCSASVVIELFSKSSARFSIGAVER